MKGKNINKFLSIVIALTMIIIPLLKTDSAYAASGDSGTLQVHYKNLVESVAAAAGSEDWELIITDAQGTFAISKGGSMTHDRKYADKIQVEIVIGSAIINGSGKTKQANNLVPFTISNNKFEFSVPEGTSPTVQFRDIVLFLTFDEQEVDISLEKVGTWIDKNDNGFTDVGEEIEYEFTITNTGDVTLTNVELVDEMLGIDGFVIDSLEPIGTTTGSGVYVHTDTYKISDDDLTLGSLVNIATVSAEAGDDTVKDTDSDTIEIKIPEPEPWEGEIEVVKSVYDEETEEYLDDKEGFTFELYKSDDLDFKKTAITNKDGIALFSNLEEGTYILKEVAMDGYTSDIGEEGKTVILTEEGYKGPKEIEVKNIKEYEDPNGEDDKGKLTIIKYVEDEEYLPQAMKVSLEPLKFKFKVTGPEDYEEIFELVAGESIVLEDLAFGEYSIEEIESHGYVPNYDPESKKLTISENQLEGTFKVTNKPQEEIEKIDITGKKVWSGGPSTKPTIELQLYRDGKVYGEPVALKNGETSYTWEELDKTDGEGHEYKYTIDEVNVPSNYRKTISEDGLTITNRYRSSGGSDPDRPRTDPEEPVEIIDDPEPPAGEIEPEPEVPEIIEEPEVPQALPDTGTFFNTTIIAVLGLLLLALGIFINKAGFIKG